VQLVVHLNMCDGRFCAYLGIISVPCMESSSSTLLHYTIHYTNFSTITNIIVLIIYMTLNTINSVEDYMVPIRTVLNNMLVA
jgi:hypothetical protein